MRVEHLKYLVCPTCKGELEAHGERESGEIRSGELLCGCGARFPIIDSIPRFVESNNYADSFGFEWLKHKKTQYDSASGIKASEERFKKETRWSENLKGEVIIEAGSGSGRFTRHALESGAMVISFDYSRAVEANFESNGAHENLLLVQASIYEMPFRDCAADKIFCFGVLQHTPDAKSAINALVKKLAGGGRARVRPLSV